MEPKVIPMIKKIWGWTDDQIKHLTPKHERLIEKGGDLQRWRLVAEVIEARNCIAGLKKGDEYVFHGSGFLLPEESTKAKICLWALGPIIPFSYMLYDRVGEGRDPSELWIDRVRCTDVGVERGGYGEVLFRVYCREKR